MSWHFLQGQEEVSWEGSCLDGVPSALSSLLPTPGASSSPGSATECCPASQSGMTCEPSMESRGEAGSMSSAGDSLARTSPPPARARESKASTADCGTKWHESSVKYDRDLCSWRTHRSLWQEVLRWSSVILPRWGMTRSGVVFQHPIAERPISEIDSGLSEWATPVCMDSLPPKSVTALHKEATMARPGRSKPANLRDQVSNAQNWPTPRSTDADRGGRGDLIQAIRENPNSHYRLWPTPRARESNDYQNVNRDKNGVSRGIALTLNGAVKLWATPTASTGGQEPEGTTGRKLTTQVGGQLNPTWVEWLMGWPLGWTDLKPLAMDRFREWQQQHGGF